MDLRAFVEEVLELELATMGIVVLVQALLRLQHPVPI